jgi:hypothetical protein
VSLLDKSISYTSLSLSKFEKCFAADAAGEMCAAAGAGHQPRASRKEEIKKFALLEWKNEFSLLREMRAVCLHTLCYYVQ